jgi:hypothetical protein
VGPFPPGIKEGSAGTEAAFAVCGTPAAATPGPTGMRLPGLGNGCPRGVRLEASVHADGLTARNRPRPTRPEQAARPAPFLVIAEVAPNGGDRFEGTGKVGR